MEHFGLTVATVIFCFGRVVRTLVTSTKKKVKVTINVRVISFILVQECEFE
jgi:hypothetical protein